jgi:hypothetical protein
MLSPRAVAILLRHFDAIDEAVSSRMTRKRPWNEEALTALLCDLLDGDTQFEENIGYTLRQVHEDLAKSDEPLAVQFRIETRQYPKHLERWVTQSDLGLIVNYEDQFASARSVRRAWLLQAKRVFPLADGEYELASKFDSTDADQTARMRILQDWAGIDFIRYLLYCPRPKSLRPPVREALNQMRTNALDGPIFDYTLGLQLRDDLLSEKPTVAAGMFVARLDAMPKTLGETHAALFRSCTPFSWFIIQHLSGDGHLVNRHSPYTPDDGLMFENNPKAHEIECLIRGDHRVLQSTGLPASLSPDSTPRFLPEFIVEVSVVSGLDRPRFGQG